MHLTVYYLVRRLEDNRISYADGPFASYVDAYDAKQNHYYSKEKYEIFETVMEGKLL
jgi:hypothetical protein